MKHLSITADDFETVMFRFNMTEKPLNFRYSPSPGLELKFRNNPTLTNLLMWIINKHPEYTGQIKIFLQCGCSTAYLPVIGFNKGTIEFIFDDKTGISRFHKCHDRHCDTVAIKSEKGFTNFLVELKREDNE